MTVKRHAASTPVSGPQLFGARGRHTWGIHLFCGTREFYGELTFGPLIRVHLFLSDVIYCIKNKIIVKQNDDEV
jgi:hypothetical protein